MDKSKLIALAGGIWGCVGIFLIFRGSQLYQLASNSQGTPQNAIIISLCIALFIGFFKGKFVLSKTARRNKTRISALGEPVQVHQVFAPPFYGLIAGMILLGILLRNFNQMVGGYVVVGAIYCGVGLALLVASRVYWKSSPATE